MKSATWRAVARRPDAARGLQVQRRGGSAAAALLAALLVGASAGPARAAEDGRAPLGDLLHIVVTPRALLAVDGEGGGETREDLELGEQVLWIGSRGAVGVALTDRRLLAVRTLSGSWQSTRWRSGESRPAAAELGDRVALLTTDRRLLFFRARAGAWSERRLELR